MIGGALIVSAAVLASGGEVEAAESASGDEMGQPRKAVSDCPADEESSGAPLQDNLYKQRVADSVFHRTGFVLGVSLGVSGCDTGDFCRGRGFWSRTAMLEGQQGQLAQRPGPGPSVLFELGLRPIPYVEALAFGHFSYHPTHIDQPSFFPAGNPFTFTASGGLAVNARPLAFTRFDPYIGFGLGYHVYRSKIDYTRAAGLETRAEEQLVRLLLRPTIGLDIFVAKNVALGPRFDYDLFVTGQYCNRFEITEVDGTISDGGGCNDVRDLMQATDPEGDRAEGTLPRMWRVGLTVRAYM